MKLKYYLRGLGVGIIVTTVILAISFGGKKTDIDDIPVEEVIAKATMLGMIMPEDTQTPATEVQDGTEAALGEDTGSDTFAADDESNALPEDTAGSEDTIGEGNTVSAEDGTDGAPEAADDSETTAAPEDTGGENPVPEENQAPYRLVVNRGDVCRTVCEDLAANGLIEDAEVFRKYLQEIGYASFISAGSYDIPYGLTQEEIADILKNGPIEEQR